MERLPLIFGFQCHPTHGIEDFFDLQGPLIFNMVMVMKRGRNSEVQVTRVDADVEVEHEAEGHLSIWIMFGGGP